MDLFEHAASKLLEDEFGVPGGIPNEEEEDEEMEEIPDEEIEPDEEEEDYASMDLYGLIDAYLDKHNLYRMDGERGVENLERLLQAIGYGSGWGGGILPEFLADNSGCIEKILEWIGETDVPEWRENLINNMHEEF